MYHISPFQKLDGDKINLRSVVNKGSEYTFSKQNLYIKDELSHKQRSDFSESLMKDLNKTSNLIKMMSSLDNSKEVSINK